jgi:hypothetical protein
MNAKQRDALFFWLLFAVASALALGLILTIAAVTP